MRPETLKTVLLPDFSVRIMSSVLSEEGLDSKPAFEAANLPPELPSMGRQNITGEQELRFQKGFVSITGYSPRLWVKTGLRYRVVAYGLLGLALMTIPTLRHMFSFSARTHLNYSLATTRPIRNGDEVIGQVLELDAVPEELHDFTIYRDFAALTVLLQDLWTDRFPFTSVGLGVRYPEKRPDDLLGYRVSYDARRTSWYWPPYLADRPLFHGDEVLYEVYAEQCRSRIESAALPDDLIAALNAAIGELGDASLVQLAKALGLSERTLQRRLEERGIRFRTLIDDTRKKRAMQMLSTTHVSISEIAWQTGYADLASFNHAFRRWTGKSPRSFRRNIIS